MATINLEIFEKDFFILNPNGSSVEAWRQIVYTINEKTKPNGDKIEYSWLKEKYKDYIDYWDITFGSRDQKFVAGKDKKRNIYDYMTEELYNNSFEISLSFPDRDHFLFGDIENIKSLKSKVDIWRKKLNDKIWNPKTTD